MLAGAGVGVGDGRHLVDDAVGRAEAGGEAAGQVRQGQGLQGALARFYFSCVRGVGVGRGGVGGGEGVLYGSYFTWVYGRAKGYKVSSSCAGSGVYGWGGVGG